MAIKVGTSGPDTIVGGGGDDFLYGLGSNDVLQGGLGADTLNGGSGVDMASYVDSGVGVQVHLVTGLGFGGTAEGDTLISIENLRGSYFNDTLYGDDAANTIWGDQGYDSIGGGGGADWLYGGDGIDVLSGGDGADHIDGGPDNDTAIYGGSPEGVHVSLTTGIGDGGFAEGDLLVCIENLWGSAFDDVLWGDGGRNVFFGFEGDDSFKGGGGDDYIVAAEGNDWLGGGSGADSLYGGGGTDTVAYDGSPAGVFVWLGGNAAHYGDAEGDALTSIENLNGSAHDDDLWGDNGDNVFAGMNGNDELKGVGGADILLGGGGSDVLYGGDGDDTLNGGNGGDTMIGGVGSDTYFVGSASDAVTESGGQGIDTVLASASWTLAAGADVETLQTTNDAGVTAIDLSGNSSGNVVRGNNGNNVINGGDGDDELTGLGGQDSFLFNTPLSADFNIDAVTDFTVGSDTIVLENTIFGAFSAGDLAAEQFVVGAAAQDASDCIIYNDTTGALLYDSDGNGAAAAIQFAQLASGLALSHNDFLIV